MGSNRVLKVTAGGGSSGEVRIESASGKVVTLRPPTTLAADTTFELPVIHYYVNVKTDYNAVGDGVADDATAIQNAIDSLASTGGCLYFPPGNYRCNSTLDFTSVANGIAIMGAATHASRIYFYGSYAAGIDLQSATDVGGVEIANISIIGEQTQPTALVQINNRHMVYIHDCYFQAAQYLLYLYNQMNHVFIHHNTFSWKTSPAPSVDSYCIYTREVTHLAIVGNSFENNHTNISCLVFGGVSSSYCQAVKIIGNSSNGTHAKFIQLGVSGSAGDFRYFTIVGNTAHEVDNAFLSQALRTLSYSIISDNAAYGVGTGTGIALTGTATEVQVSGNKIFNFSTSYNLSGLSAASAYRVAQKLELGDDVNIYRSAADKLKTDDDLVIADGKKVEWSDTNIYRSAANTLKTDDKLNVAQAGNDIGVDVDKTGTGAGNALDIANAGTGNAIYASQTGAATAVSLAQSQNNDVLALNKTGTGAGSVIAVTNSGTGKDIIGNSGNWSIDKNGNAGFIGDLDALGGYRQTLTGFYYDNVPASLGATDMALSSSGNKELVMTRSGSVTGIAAKADQALTAGTITLTVYKNGVSIGLAFTLNSSTQWTYQTQAKDTDGFSAGDRLKIVISSDASLNPNGAIDIDASIEIET